MKTPNPSKAAREADALAPNEAGIGSRVFFDYEGTRRQVTIKGFGPNDHVYIKADSPEDISDLPGSAHPNGTSAIIPAECIGFERDGKLYHLIWGAP